MAVKLAIVVEDDPGVGGVYIEALKQAGFTAELFNNGRVALARLAVAVPVPDLVVLDLNLPVVSGETILQAIRANERLAGTRIIVTTGEAHRAQEMQSRADLVLVKPVSAIQLSDLAARMIMPPTGPLADDAAPRAEG
jgi:two-component system chemotaxis response regulator CheY